MACKMVRSWQGMASLLTLRMMILPSKTERGSSKKVSELMASAGILSWENGSLVNPEYSDGSWQKIPIPVNNLSKRGRFLRKGEGAWPKKTRKQEGPEGLQNRNLESDPKLLRAASFAEIRKLAFCLRRCTEGSSLTRVKSRPGRSTHSYPRSIPAVWD